MLFKNINDFGIVDVNTSFPKLQSYIQDAEDQYLLKVLGSEMLGELQTAYNASIAPSPTALSSEMAALLQKSRSVVRNMTMYVAIPKMNIHWNNMGATKPQSADYDSASAGEVFFARIQFLIDGYRAIDTLYQFLEENIDDYETWEESDACSTFKNYFVNTAIEFQKHANITESRWLFSRMIPTMEVQQELYVLGAIGEDFFAELLELAKDGSGSDEEKLVINKLRKIISLYTYSASLIDPTIREILRVINATTAEELTRRGSTDLGADYKSTYEKLSEQKLSEANALMAGLKKYLNTNASDSLFQTYFESDIYSNGEQTISNYNNDSSSSTFACL